MISKQDSNSELGSTIREARGAKGLSLRALEHLTGVPNAHLESARDRENRAAVDGVAICHRRGA